MGPYLAAIYFLIRGQLTMSTNNQINPFLQQALTSLREYYEPKIIIGQKITVEDREQIKAILAISDASFEGQDSEFIVYGLLKICFDLPNSFRKNSTFDQKLKDWQDALLAKLKDDEHILLENFRESDEIEYGFLLNYCLASGLIHFLSTESDLGIKLATALLTDVIYNSWKHSPPSNNKWFAHISSYLKEYKDNQIKVDWEIPELISSAESWYNSSKLTSLSKNIEEVELPNLVSTTNEIQSEIKKISLSGKKVTDNVSNLLKYLNYDRLEKKLLWWLNVKHSNNYDPTELVSYRLIKNPFLAGLYMGLDLIHILGNEHLPAPNKVYALLIECLLLTHPDESHAKATWVEVFKEPDIRKFAETNLNSLWEILISFIPTDDEDQKEFIPQESINTICDLFKLLQAQSLIG